MAFVAVGGAALGYAIGGTATAALVGGGAGLLLGGAMGDGPSMPGQDPLIGQSAQANAKVAADTLDWYKQVYADQAGDRQTAKDIAVKTANAQTALAEQQTTIAKETNDYMKSTFRPLEQSIVADANAYDTPERRAQAAAEAGAGVQSAFQRNSAALARSQALHGINPGSGAALAAQGSNLVSLAAADANAQNSAIKQIESIGAAKKMDAASLGRNLPSNQTAQVQSAITAGNSAVANGNVPNSINTAAAGVMNQGFNTAISGNNSAGGIMNTLYGTQVSGYNAAQAADGAMWGGIGSALGGFLGGPAGGMLGSKIFGKG